MGRKHISWKTKYASALLALGDVPYTDAKGMTEDQIISLYHVDHNILHESGHPDRDKFWNLAPKLIRAHRVKTKLDAKTIAKGRRIRKKLKPMTPEERELAYGYIVTRKAIESRPRRKLRSRGFDKTRRRRMDGTVEKR